MDVESLLEDLFGFSDEDQTPILPVTEVPGLHIAKSWLPAAEQASEMILGRDVPGDRS
jgi:hypothetical protein